MVPRSNIPSRGISMDEDAIHQALLQANEYNLDDSNQRNSITGVSSALSKFKMAAQTNITYKKAEAETIRAVLDEIELVSVKRASEGFNEFNFSVGVFNCVSYEINIFICSIFLSCISPIMHLSTSLKCYVCTYYKYLQFFISVSQHASKPYADLQNMNRIH